MKMNRVTLWIGLFVFLGVAVSGVGCAPIAAGVIYGTGTYAYATGAVKETYNVGLRDAFDANIAALQNMDVTITEQTYDSFKGVIRAESPNSGKIYIEIVPAAKGDENSTEVSVRIGPFGDRPQEELVQRAIKKELAYRQALLVPKDEENVKPVIPQSSIAPAVEEAPSPEAAPAAPMVEEVSPSEAAPIAPAAPPAVGDEEPSTGGQRVNIRDEDVVPIEKDRETQDVPLTSK